MPSAFTTTDVLKCAPYGANGVTLTPSATPWAPSAWVQVDAATVTAWVLAGVHPVVPNLSAVDAEIDIGIGASGDEIPIATFSVRTGTIGTSLYGHTDHHSAILINRIPLGSRVSARIRKSGTSTSTWRVKVAYYAGPVAGSFNLTTTQGPSRIPSGAAAISVTTPASAWANSSYGVLSTALPFTCVILGANIELNASGPTFEVDLATGSPEQRIATLWESSGGASQGLLYFPLRTPLGPIVAGTKLSCLVRTSSSGALTATVSVLVMPHPY